MIDAGQENLSSSNYYFGMGEKITWNSSPGETQPIDFANQVTIVVHLQNEYQDVQAGTPQYGLAVWSTDLVNGNIEPVYTGSVGGGIAPVNTPEIIYLKPRESKDIPITINVTSTSMKISVRVQLFGGVPPIPPGGTFAPLWDTTILADDQTRDFYLLVKQPVNYWGGFSLDFLPITILYCPPDQDMTNALLQSQSYGTNITLGTNNTSSSSQTQEAGINSGVKYFVAGGVSQSTSDSAGQDTSSGQGTSVGITYVWSTTLTADNQRAIGRKYWGALGDIFVIIMNPDFQVGTYVDGTYAIGAGPQQNTNSQILILPAHKLLQPNGDPVAGLIPADVRYRILSLDPFMVNLDPFFPTDGSAPETDLTKAVDQTIDPSVGSPGTPSPPATITGDNRASLIARYSISNGIELDLNKTYQINISNTATNSSDFWSSITNSWGGNIGAALGSIFNATIQVNDTQTTGVKVSYQNSQEVIAQMIETAMCHLIRNQNEADLNDIEIWYDKLFSTFMFRIVNPSSASVGGFIGTVHPGPVPYTGELVKGKVFPVVENHFLGVSHPLQNARVELTKGNVSYRTMTDHRGKFQIHNIKEPGRYTLKVGNVRKSITVSANSKAFDKPVLIKNVKRVVNLRKAPLWELHKIGITHDKALILKKELSKKKKIAKNQLRNICKKHEIPLHLIEKISIVKIEE